jgi:hypothetical protein
LRAITCATHWGFSGRVGLHQWRRCNQGRGVRAQPAPDSIHRGTPRRVRRGAQAPFSAGGDARGLARGN